MHWLQPLQDSQGGGDEATAQRREYSLLSTLETQDAHRNQGRNGIANYWKLQEAEEALRQDRQFKRQRGDALPIVNHASRGAHHQDGHREGEVFAIIG